MPKVVGIMLAVAWALVPTPALAAIAGHSVIVDSEEGSGPFTTAVWGDYSNGASATLSRVHGHIHLTALTTTETATTFTVKTVDTSAGFTASIDPRLNAASVSGSAVPDLVCVMYADGTSKCHDSTMTINVSWIGSGPLTRFHDTQYSADVQIGRNFFYLLQQHFIGWSRPAAASGTIGARFYSDEPQPAIIGFQNTGSIFVCGGDGCEN